MGWIAYIVMVLSVFINSAGKMEITYYGWTHFHTFFLYCSSVGHGFPFVELPLITPVIVMLLLYGYFSESIEHDKEPLN